MTALPVPTAPFELDASEPIQLNPSATPLLPWQARFAEWLSSQPEKVPARDQVKMASWFAQETVSRHQLGRLRHKANFLAYWTALQLDGFRRARAIVSEHATEGVLAHFEGMRTAVAEKDYRALVQYTVPILDRVVPKRDAAVTATQVNVTLTPTRLAGFEAYVPAVVEVVEAESPTSA